MGVVTMVVLCGDHGKDGSISVMVMVEFGRSVWWYCVVIMVVLAWEAW